MATPPSPITDLASLPDSRERARYAMMVIASLIVYGILALFAWTSPAGGASVLFYVAIFALLIFFAHGMTLGGLRGSGVRVSEKQLPMLHKLVIAHAQRLGMKRAPDVYVVQSGSLLNAFATRFLGRDFVVIYSEVLEMSLRQGEAAVSFIVAHELGHLWRGHLKHRWLILPARIVPYLGAAYSRACEYTCDRVGAYCQVDGALAGLLALAAGTELHRVVDVGEFAAQAAGDDGFWVRRAELVSSHPRLPKRVSALLRAGVPVVA